MCSSDAFQRLLAEQTQCFAKLRRIRKALRTITRALHGAMPADLVDKWQAVITLDPDALHSGLGPIPTDEEPARLCGDVIQNLLADPDAPLPRESA